MADLLKNLRIRSKVWATNITKNAHKNLGKFRSLIRVESKTQDSSGRIDIVSTGISTGPPVARAYEYGSGRHSRSSKVSPKQMGSRGFIRIAPKNKKVLAFPWDKVSENTPAGKKFLGVSKSTGKALFRYVDHPGVRAANNGRGYLAPAITEVRRQIKKEIPKEIREAVLGSLRRGFK